MATNEKYLQVRVSPELHTALRMEALRRGVTVKSMVTDILQGEIDKASEEPPGDFCTCADLDCTGDHR